MLEPMRTKKSKGAVVADFVILIMLVLLVLGLVQLCDTSGLVNGEESDCLSELRADTRKDTNFTQDEVIKYGRCIEARGTY